LLGLQVDLEPFYRLAATDVRLSALAERFRGLKPPRFPTLFEALVNAIACQQITLTFGIRLLNRLAERYGLASSLEHGGRRYFHGRSIWPTSIQTPCARWGSVVSRRGRSWS
jgi:DNA-3-methyladenine glycosylase II